MTGILVDIINRYSIEFIEYLEGESRNVKAKI